MKNLFLIACTLFCLAFPAKALEVVEIRCENQLQPLGLETRQPRFSWKINSAERGVYQTEYRLLVSDNLSDLNQHRGNMWDSGWISSATSLHLLYEGKPLASAGKYYWKVKVRDNKQKESSWSAPALFGIGLPDQEDWFPAKWIAMERVESQDRIVPGYQLAGNQVTPLAQEPLMPQFRNSFEIAKKVKSATAFICGLGHFEMSVNGESVGDNFLEPAWSNYDKVSYYVTYDITDLLRRGENVVGIRLGNGFLHIPRDSTRYRKLLTTFSYPKMICKIRIAYTDGSFRDIVSNEDWKVTSSPLTYSSIYGGEDFDAGREQPGWDRPGFSDSAWQKAIEIDPAGKLTSQLSPPMKVMERLPVKSIEQTQPGVYIYDFGQNASAIVALKVKGRQGKKVVMRPGEYLTPEGRVNQNNSGYNYWFSYTPAGESTESWKPAFSYYGFRYIQVEGAVPEGEPNPDDLPVIEELTSLHVRNASERVGVFSCSSPLFNDIYSLIDWSVRSNMASVLTDCPHREKLGWLEVAHLMSHSIAYGYDIKQMYTQTLVNMKNSQYENGLIPSTAPEFAHFPGDFHDSPEWGSAAIILPWFLYQWYGDASVIADYYPMMEKYINYLYSRTDNHILYHGLGDWYDLGPAHPGYSQLTARGLTPTAIYYYDLHIMARCALLLGNEEEARYYEELADEVKKAFNEKFFDREKGYYDRGSQTANAMPLYLGIVEPEYREQVLGQIIQNIREQDNSITSGDIGFSYLLRVLETENASEVIFDMNNQTHKPGYGYQLMQGATSLTESWTALQTASHNHCMLGHLLEWFYSGLGGIKTDPDALAYKRFMIRPDPVGDITSARVTFESPYGKIFHAWEKRENRYKSHITIPANTTAVICLPEAPRECITENGVPVDNNPSVTYLGTDGKYTMYEAGSGIYCFEVEKP